MISSDMDMTANEDKPEPGLTREQKQAIADSCRECKRLQAELDIAIRNELDRPENQTKPHVDISQSKDVQNIQKEAKEHWRNDHGYTSPA